MTITWTCAVSALLTLCLSCGRENQASVRQLLRSTASVAKAQPPSSPFAQCNSESCACRPGYVGNGFHCQPVPRPLRIATGNDHTTVVQRIGNAYCWGHNAHGQCTHYTSPRLHPAAIGELITNTLAVDSGAEHSCALTFEGKVKCWGKNTYGQLGNGENNRWVNASPKDVAHLDDVLSIAASGSEHHTCALTQAGKVQCWGRNSFGQLGSGDARDHAEPVRVTGLNEPISAIFVGYRHSCALTHQGGVKCWGDNSFGKLGDGTQTHRPTPVDVVGLNTGVLSLSLGRDHSCALMKSGSVKCWGYNPDGRFGTGSVSESPNAIPADVATLGNDVAQIDAGSWHTCAVMKNSTVQCFGANDSGALGNGSDEEYETPVTVMTGPGVPLIGVKEVSAGADTTCALLWDEGVFCWGENVSGQVGDGTQDDRYYATRVANF